MISKIYRSMLGPYRACRFFMLKHIDRNYFQPLEEVLKEDSLGILINKLKAGEYKLHLKSPENLSNEFWLGIFEEIGFTIFPTDGPDRIVEVNKESDSTSIQLFTILEEFDIARLEAEIIFRKESVQMNQYKEVNGKVICEGLNGSNIVYSRFFTAGVDCFGLISYGLAEEYDEDIVVYSN